MKSRKKRAKERKREGKKERKKGCASRLTIITIIITMIISDEQFLYIEMSRAVWLGCVSDKAAATAKAHSVGGV